MNKFGKIPYTIYALTLLGAALIPAIFQEIAASISGIFVQFHLCGQGDSSCVFIGWVAIIVIIMIVPLGFDFLLNKQVQKIELEDVFKFTAHSPLEKFSTEPRWASINIENIGPIILTNCFVTLDDLLDTNGKSVLKVKRKRRLLWSQGDPPRETEKDISPGEQKVIDVATTFPNNKKMTTETQAGQEPKDKGMYEALITVYGREDGIIKKKTSRFILEYTGGNVLTIIEKGAPKWENSNPKRTRMRRRPSDSSFFGDT